MHSELFLSFLCNEMIRWWSKAIKWGHNPNLRFHLNRPTTPPTGNIASAAVVPPLSTTMQLSSFIAVAGFLLMLLLHRSPDKPSRPLNTPKHLDSNRTDSYAINNATKVQHSDLKREVLWKIKRDLMLFFMSGQHWVHSMCVWFFMHLKLGSYFTYFLGINEWNFMTAWLVLIIVLCFHNLFEVKTLVHLHL